MPEVTEMPVANPAAKPPNNGEQNRFRGKEFFQKTLDSLLLSIAILEEGGTIIAVNALWNTFARENGLEEARCGPGANYLLVCDRATGDNAEEASLVAGGIRDVIAGRRPDFYLEYPCHSPTESRW